MDTLYHIIIGTALLLASPFVALRMAFDSRFRRDMLPRLGHAFDLAQQKDCLWVHAASVGEVQVAKLLIRASLQKHPDRSVVLSTFTTTGYELAVAENLCPVFRMPLDVPFLLRPVLKRINPAMLVLIEAEFWPALLRLCRQRGVPVTLVNGRMSERSFRQYHKILPIYHWLTENIVRFAMRSPQDAERVKNLETETDRILVTGNMKFDALPPGSKSEHSDAEKNPVMVFGSTRPGDEKHILDVIARFGPEFPEWRYVLAPRHVQRTEEVAGLIQGKNLPYTLHSQLETGNTDFPQLILVDELGTLNDYYRSASIAFVGGGFNPEHGGQNILEPALLGVPVIFGPHMENFKEEARLLSESGGGIQISHPNALLPALIDLATQPGERKRRGSLAAITVEENRGAVYRNLELIHDLLDSPCLKVLRTSEPS